MRVITLLTDFGNGDYFVASMKGVILSIDPNVTIVDVTHDVPSFNILKAAFILWATYRYFPRGSIHVVVVDPGVGTNRRAIAVMSRNYYFIGPDNGVLTMAAEDDGVVEVREISNRRVMLSEVSSTFHGRDVFAPAAAYLGLVDFKDYGPLISDYVKLTMPKPIERNGVIEAQVIYVDKFGNVYTSVRRGMFNLNYGDSITVNAKGRGIRVRISKSYGYVNRGEALALFNSMGFLELAVNGGSFSSEYGLSEGDVIQIAR
ncbi:SAM-dependent chlorinase/fluorinase [Caldivirga sp.]|uniref:SAM hydrolase/SAM-dependent halogenase family protein n=1 Tax=Caldivirga sp. TaxID=2080243 RepID=UPI0025C6F1F6|nr:SAM-dependent chlorinase/fluorinase [Caldivirga sp.]